MKKLNIALVGNPNCGKSSIFNILTGLRQKVGNFPGVTVDKKSGSMSLPTGQPVSLIDLPGTYSLFPNALDERVVVNILANHQHADYPDLIVYVADITDLEKQLLLLTQILDLQIPTILALNMSDLKDSEGIHIQQDILQKELQVPVLEVSGRTGTGIPELKQMIIEVLKNPRESNTFISMQMNGILEDIKNVVPIKTPYEAKLNLHHAQWLDYLPIESKFALGKIASNYGFNNIKEQIDETMLRYQKITPLVRQTIKKKSQPVSTSDKLDEVLTHSFFGPIIFFILMALVFQAIFTWAGIPMDWIDGLFAQLGSTLEEMLPNHWVADLLINGLLAGIGATVIFIPQIAILFLFISILEEVGYMARAVYLFDRLMQRFGLNGRSMVALISGNACAIPAIMSTRTISNWKERLITILITPFMSCSARIPVYIILIGIAVPSVTYFGIFNAQGLAFGLLYLLGLGGALALALVLKYALKINEASYLAMALPEYKMPSWRNVSINVYEKVKTFVVEAGKIIVVISIILWVLSSFGPGNSMQEAAETARKESIQLQLDEQETNNMIAAGKLEVSYAGRLGKAFEPIIRPIGFDWKIGIALLTSFAAREVFVGTIATIHQIGSDAPETKVIDRLALAVNPATGERIFNRATSWSLLIFFVFAMQCMSTLAVVKRETKSWKWPIFQFVLMTGIAYIASFIVYSLLA